jgi:hypothetical protein
MPLQVRLVQALGDRLIELPEPTSDTPLVIGRGEEADVAVAEAAVSRRHALIWLREGRWLIQDARGSVHTLVNGRPVERATVLRSGDVVGLGPGTAATLVIDPFGLMTTGPARVSQAVGRQAVHRAPAPRAAGLAPGMPPQQEFAVEEPAESNGDGADDDWLNASAAAAARSNQRFYVPKQSSWTPGLISALIFSTLLLSGIAWYVYHVKQRANEEALKAEQAKAREQQRESTARSTTQAAEAERLRQLAIQKAREAATRMAVTSTENAAAQDPGRQTLEWKKVEEAHAGFTPKEAIVVYSDYIKQRPDSPYAGDIRKYTDEALDRLWWEHIAQLIADRQEVVKEIKQKNADIASTKDEDTKKTLADEKAPLEERLAHIDGQLKAMNYQSEAKPVVEDEKSMAELRRARNPVIYDPWKEATEKRIKESRGQRAVSFPGEEEASS